MPTELLSTFKGQMAERVRRFDWGATPLGPFNRWHPEVKSWVEYILESRFPHAVIAREGLVTIYNDAFKPILGNKLEALGRSFAEVWAEVWDEIGPFADRAFAGEATFIEDFPLTVNRNGAPDQAWFTFCYSPLRLSSGEIAGMMDTVIETTATVRARQELDFLNRELSHRLKNSMAMVHAIARQNLRDVQETPSVQSFLRRIVAIGQTEEKLRCQSGSPRNLADIVEASTSPLGGRQINVDGPEIELGSHTCTALSMILFELATNAAKYGALAVPRGEVLIRWKIESDVLALTWREAGGPEVAEPERIGFGSRLIDRGLGPGSTVHRRYPHTGFEADIRIPLLLMRR